MTIATSSKMTETLICTQKKSINTSFVDGALEDFKQTEL